MSAVVGVVQNKSGSWTARGQYGGVYAEVTCKTRFQAVAALDKALHAFDNNARPTHANPPPGTEPSGTHPHNDGLDEMRKP